MPRTKMQNPIHYVTIVHTPAGRHIIESHYKMSFMAAQRVMSKRVKREFPTCTHFDFFLYNYPNKTVTQFRRNTPSEQPTTASTTILRPQDGEPIRLVRSDEKAPI